VRRNLHDERFHKLFRALLDADADTLNIEEVSKLDNTILDDLGSSIRNCHVVEYDPNSYVRFSSIIAKAASGVGK